MDPDTDSFPPELPNIPMPKDVRDELIMSDEELTKLVRYIGAFVRMKAEGQAELPPLLMTVINLPPEEMEAAKTAFCDEQDIPRWQFDSALEEAEAGFQPVVMLLPEEWGDDRQEWLWKQGRDWQKNHPKHYPRVFMVAAETWYVEPDEDNPNDETMDHTSSKYIRPMLHPRRKEAVMVVAQTLDQRCKFMMMPIDRDPEAKMLIGPPINWMTEEGKTTNYLGQSFWRGYFYTILRGEAGKGA